MDLHTRIAANPVAAAVNDWRTAKSAFLLVSSTATITHTRKELDRAEAALVAALDAADAGHAEMDRLRASNSDAMQVVADTRRMLAESDAEKQPLRAEIARLRDAVAAASLALSIAWDEITVQDVRGRLDEALGG